MFHSSRAGVSVGLSTFIRLAGSAVLGLALVGAGVEGATAAPPSDPVPRSIELVSTVAGDGADLVDDAVFRVVYTASGSSEGSESASSAVDLPAEGAARISLADDQTEVTLSVHYPVIEGVRFESPSWSNADGSSMTTNSYTVAFALPAIAGLEVPTTIPVAVQTNASLAAATGDPVNTLTVDGTVTGEAAGTVGAATFELGYDVDGATPADGVVALAAGETFTLDVDGDASIELRLTPPTVDGVAFGDVVWLVDGAEVQTGGTMHLAFATAAAAEGAEAEDRPLHVGFRVEATLVGTGTEPLDPGGAPETLAETGQHPLPLLAAVALLVAAGAGAILLARRRAER